MEITLETVRRMMSENGGDLDLHDSDVTELPEGLAVPGSLDLRHARIESLPRGLSVGGSLRLDGSGIRSLPAGLTVPGDLCLACAPVESLPENLSVGGSLDLRGSRIRSLPEDLSVGGDLYLDYTDVAELPHGLSVGGCLRLYGSGVTELPEDLSAEYIVGRDGTRITAPARKPAASLREDLLPDGDPCSDVAPEAMDDPTAAMDPGDARRRQPRVSAVPGIAPFLVPLAAGAAILSFAGAASFRKRRDARHRKG